MANWLQSEARSKLTPVSQNRRGIVGKIEPGQTLYSKYEVIKWLGGGAMGDVWLVRHLTLHSENALKVIVPNFARNPLALMRFQREFQVMATLRHEHAVTIYDACIDEEGGYIDMEFVNGLTLESILSTARNQKERDPTEPLMPFPWILRILEQLGEVLQTAHEKGIVHRDLKPSNMMLLNGRRPGREYLKVLDFGIAKVRDDPEGASGREQELLAHKTEGFVGTPSYGSPEQAMNREDIDGRADLYSVGIMLYEFLTGHLPFRGTPFQVMTQNLSATPPPFEMINPRLRPMPEVEHAVLRILSKDRDHRPRNARELFEEFRQAVEAIHPNGIKGPGREGVAYSYFGNAEQPTEPESPAAVEGLLSTVESTLVLPPDRAEPVKHSLESLTDLGPVLPDRPGPPWRVISAVVGLVFVLAIAGLAVALRPKPRQTETVEIVKTTEKGPRFEDYWPENFVPVDATDGDRARPARVRQTVDDRYFTRFATGIYLPEGYAPEDPNALVDGWPAVIVRNKIRFIRIEGNKEGPMGAWDADLEPGRNDTPAHAVKLSGYYLQETEVTNGQYEDYLDQQSLSRPKDWEEAYSALIRINRDLARQHPAVNLSRKQAMAFARSIDAQLPTEAQWEFAARSRGEKFRFVWGNQPIPSRLKANIDSDSDRTTAPVKSYPDDKTVQGIFDMLGNVQEFCRDGYQPYKVSTVTTSDPCTVPDNPSNPVYVVRGASFISLPPECTTTHREKQPADEISPKFGFRLVVECPDTRQPR
jgi:serine/threonine-protein kinase